MRFHLHLPLHGWISCSRLSILLVLFLSTAIYGQQVEIQGKAKISVMDTMDQAQLLVVKQPDGTLATRQLSSLPFPPPDTTRTLVSDMQLVKLLCDCPSIPPGMVNSLLENGYAISDLLDFGVAIPDLVNSGITLTDLINAGASSGGLFNAGFSVQELLQSGMTPVQIYSGGVALSEIYGEVYEGGIIFYLDDLDTIPGVEGLVATPSEQGGIYDWGCLYLTIGGTGEQIGTGANNTMLIDAGCTTPYIAADFCANFALNGYTDWFLPSQAELAQMYLNLHSSGLGGFLPAFYWSSSEASDYPDAQASLISFSNGIATVSDKDSYYRVRPARAF